MGWRRASEVPVCQPHQEVAAVTQDDVLYRFRLRALALDEELGNVRAACRMLGIHHSTFYRWRKIAHRHGLELLSPPRAASPADAQSTQPDARAAGAGVLPGPSRLRASADRQRARTPQVGRLAHLGQRGLGGLAPAWAQHACASTGACGRLRGPTRAARTTPAARASDRRQRSGRARADGLLLHRAAHGHQGHRLAVHRHRRLLELPVGRVAHQSPQPGGSLHLTTGRACGA